MKVSKILVAVSAALVLAFTSCASTKVDRVSSDTQIDLSGYWNDSDVKIVCESLINDCISSPRIAKFEDQNGRAPNVKLGKFANKSSEHIDTKIVAQKFQTAIIKSGVLEFVADNDQVAEIREEQSSQADFASVDTAAEMFNETGADWMLQGSVRTIVDTLDNQTVRTYYVEAQLIDVTTTKIIWQGENSEIKKYIKRAKVKA